MRLGEVARVDERELRRQSIVALRLRQEREAQERRDRAYERWVDATYERMALHYDRGLQDGRRSFIHPIPQRRLLVGPIVHGEGPTGRRLTDFVVRFAGRG